MGLGSQWKGPGLSSGRGSALTPGADGGKDKGGSIPGSSWVKGRLPQDHGRCRRSSFGQQTVMTPA